MRWSVHIIFLVTALSCAVSSGCMTTRDYAAVYRRATKPTAGLEQAGQCCKRAQRAAQIHQRLGLPQQQAMLQLRCNLLRQQLCAAAVRARHHTTWVLGFPLAWPVHAITLYSWPTMQALTAANVSKAAQQLEQAYQNSDEHFLTVCKQQLQTRWGKIFAQQQPACT